VKERVKEVRDVLSRLIADLEAKRVIPVVGPQRAIAFRNWIEGPGKGVTDGCAYRMVMKYGTNEAKRAILAAEQAAGLTVNRQAVHAGHHSHDGGKTWHRGH